MKDPIDPEDLGDSIEAMIWAAAFADACGMPEDAWDEACAVVRAYRAERERRKEAHEALGET